MSRVRVAARFSRHEFASCTQTTGGPLIAGVQRADADADAVRLPCARPGPGGRGWPCGPTPLRCSEPWRTAELASRPAAAALRQAAVSQKTKRATRAATARALLVAPPWGRGGHRAAEPRRRDFGTSISATTAWNGFEVTGLPSAGPSWLDFCAGTAFAIKTFAIAFGFCSPATAGQGDSQQRAATAQRYR